ncbi:MAG: transposase [Verrucomicrobia bacterium]|nr:transposase [Verrucomicrobiota bacterium]
MARALRVQFEGAIYHVTSRGNERRAIFRTDADRSRFCETLAENVKAHHIRVYAYVLMTNHYHLLLETPRANLSAFMQQFNGGYTGYFNRRHRRSGHLYGGRYKAKLVEGDEYLLNLTRYVHLNPVKIRRMDSLSVEERQKALRAYRWSSYRAYAGLGEKQEWMDYGPLSELTAQGRKKRETVYRQYVEGGLAKTDEELREAIKRSTKAIGLETFCRWAETAYRDLAQEQGPPLDVAMRTVETPPEPEGVLDAVCSHFKMDQAELRRRRHKSDARLFAMKLLKEEAGLTQREVAVRLGLRDGSGISRQLSELSVRLRKDRTLCRKYEKLRETIVHNH